MSGFLLFVLIGLFIFLPIKIRAEALHPNAAAPITPTQDPSACGDET